MRNSYLLSFAIWICFARASASASAFLSQARHQNHKPFKRMIRKNDVMKHSSASSSDVPTPAIEIMEEDVSLRFSGVGRLYQNEHESNANAYLDTVDRLSKSTVAIAGIGGVGSWAAEAICRSGVGNIILIDLGMYV